MVLSQKLRVSCHQRSRQVRVGSGLAASQGNRLFQISFGLKPIPLSQIQSCAKLQQPYSIHRDGVGGRSEGSQGTVQYTARIVQTFRSEVERSQTGKQGRPLGSGRLLSDQQASKVQRLLDENSPEDLGIPAPLWNRRAVRDLIHQECGVLLAVRTVGKYLEEQGVTLLDYAWYAVG